MSQDLKPVYQIKTLSSNAEPVEWLGLEIVAQEINNGYAVLWQHHAVFTGQIDEGTIQWLNGEHLVSGDEHIVRLRAFNEKEEYHYWRTSDGIKGRLRRDSGTESKADVIDTQMVLRSVVANPLKKVSAEFGEATIGVLTRNYIGYDNETKQAGYVDSRFVDFEQFNAK
jgi:hypothetical protein